MDWTLLRQVVSQEMLSGLSESTVWPRVGETKPPFEQAASWARLASLCATCKWPKRIEEKSGGGMTTVSVTAVCHLNILVLSDMENTVLLIATI